MITEDFIDLVRRMREEQKSVCGYMRRELEQEVDNELLRLSGGQVRGVMEEEACNTDCFSYANGTCPFARSEKLNCTRYRVMNGLRKRRL